MSTRRELLGAVAAAATAAAGSRPFRAFAAGTPLRIGAVLPFSGGLAPLGYQAKIGIDLAISEINAAGGILGNPVELIYQDNRTDANTSVERTMQLIERDRVLAVLGPITSSAREAMMPVHRRLRTPLLYATDYEGGACDRYLFSFNTVPNQELDRLVPELIRRAGGSFHLLGSDCPWARTRLEQAATLVRSFGGSVTGSELVPSGTVEFASIIRRIAGSGARVLLTALPGTDGVDFVAQAEALGLMAQVTVGYLGLTEVAAGRFGPGKGRNLWVAVPFAASIDEPKVRDFVVRVRRLAGNDVPISHYVMTHYNALKAIEAAAMRAGKATGEALVDALEGLVMAIPTGTLIIGKDHHVTLDMFLAHSEGNGLSVVQPLGAQLPRAGCARLSADQPA